MLALALPVLGPGLWLAHPLEAVRTPVEWGDAPCITVVDRSVEPIATLSYSIPIEDTEHMEAEPADSLTMQFFGFCRDRRLDEALPNWITEADLDDAASFGLGDASVVDREADVLDNSPTWAGCFTRITTEDERRPITFEAAAEPVLWDTSALAAGTWAVEGYTYAPWFNLWSPHPGVFKIVDDPDPAASEPAAALTFPEQILFGGGEFEISGCVSAMDGASLSVSWAHVPSLDAPDPGPSWAPIAEALPVEGESFALTWEAPDAAGNEPILIAVEVVDPEGRSFTAHANQTLLLLVVGGGDETDGDETDGDETTGAPVEAGDDDGASGCGCRSADASSRAPLAAWILVPVFVSLSCRRRRR